MSMTFLQSLFSKTALVSYGKNKIIGEKQIATKDNNPNNSTVSINKSKLSTRGCPTVYFKRKRQNRRRFILGGILDSLPLSSIMNIFYIHVLNEK